MKHSKIWLAATAIVGTLAALPAHAQTYRFDLFDPLATQGGAPLDGNIYTFYFDSHPAPLNVGANQFSLFGVITYSAGAQGSFTLVPTQFDFYNDSFGGLSTTFDIYFGDVLFTGPTSAPVFKLGTFALDTGRSVTISAPVVTPPPVPEPATWAMMIAGFGLTGSAIRYRRRKTVISFA